MSDLTTKIAQAKAELAILEKAQHILSQGAGKTTKKTDSTQDDAVDKPTLRMGDFALEILEPKPLRAKEIVDRFLEAGYQTSPQSIYGTLQALKKKGDVTLKGGLWRKK